MVLENFKSLGGKGDASALLVACSLCAYGKNQPEQVDPSWNEAKNEHNRNYNPGLGVGVNSLRQIEQTR